jgi:glucose-1-phosphate adenylyltransferase
LVFEDFLVKGGTMSTLALILAGGRATRLGVLSQRRAESAMPFAGKYRLIDFALSNCANSGILNVGILTQYHPQSLNNHVRNGRPWDLDRSWSGRVTLLPPYRRSNGGGNWYEGTADSVYQNLDFILDYDVDTVLLLPGEHVYKMDYETLVTYHQELQADVTIGVVGGPMTNGAKRDFLVSDSDGRVMSIHDTPLLSPHSWLSMGIYVFRTEFLARRLTQDAASFVSSHDLAKDVIPHMLAQGDRVYVYPFNDYWVNVDSVQAYWRANMDLLVADPPLRLQDEKWCIRTRNEERPPVAISNGARISNSLITEGCIVHGQVENSVLSPGVKVGPEAVIRDSIIFSDCDIGPQAVVNRSILDKSVTVGRKAHVGYGLDSSVKPNWEKDLIPTITLIGRDTHLPSDFSLDADSIFSDDVTRDVVSSSFASSPQRDGLRRFQIVSELRLASHGNFA